MDEIYCSTCSVQVFRRTNLFRYKPFDQSWIGTNALSGSHKLEKYLNLEGFLQKTLKIKSALKVLENHSKSLKSP